MLNKIKNFFKKLAQGDLVASGVAVGTVGVVGAVVSAVAGLPAHAAMYGAVAVGLYTCSGVAHWLGTRGTVSPPTADGIEADMVEVIEADMVEVIEADVVEAIEAFADAVVATFVTEAETSWEVDSAALLGADATSYLEAVLAAQVDQIVEAGQSRTTRKALGKYVRKQLRADLDDVVSALVRDFQVPRLDAEAIVLGPFRRVLEEEIAISIQGRIAA